MGVSHWLGWLYSKVGRRCNKLFFLKDVGGGDWLVVAVRFFGDKDKYVQYGRNKAVSVSPYPCHLVKKQEHWGFMDFDTGDEVNFSGGVVQGMSPEQLSVELNAKDAENITRGGSVSGLMTLILVGGLAFVVGGVVAFSLHGVIMSLLGVAYTG